MTGTLVTTAVSLLTLAIATRALGASSYGALAAAAAYLAVPALLSDLGIRNSVVRTIAREGNRKAELLSTGLSAATLVSIVWVAVAVAVALVLPFDSQERLAIAIGALGTVFAVADTSLLPVFQITLRLHWWVASNVASRVTTFAFVALAAWADFGLAGVAAAFAAGNAVTLGMDFVVARRLVPLRFSLRLEPIRALVRASFLLGFSVIVAGLAMQLGQIILALLDEPEEVAYFALAFKLPTLVITAAGAAAGTVFPILASRVAAADPRAQQVHQRTFDALVAFGGVVGMVLLARADDLVRLIGGPDFEEAATPLRVLAPVPLLVFAYMAAAQLLMASHADRILLAANAAVLVSTLALAVPLVLARGATGLAIATTVGQVLPTLALLGVTQRRLGTRRGYRFAVLSGTLAVMLGVALASVGGSWMLTTAVAILVYAAALVAVPGTGREVTRAVARSIMRRPNTGGSLDAR